MKSSVGMCLFNVESKQMEFHNEALSQLLGMKDKLYNAVLKPKKRKIQMATKESLLKVYKESELHQQAIIIDKNPQTLLQVILEVVRNCQINAMNNNEQDYLFRYNVTNTRKNIVISAKNITLNFNEYSILTFYEID
jgi:mannose/fructose/N-acetylgalactosamine-specific phosphotransferase system component IIB